MKAMLGFLLATTLAACAVPGPREPERYFILDAAITAPRPGVSVAVAPTTAASFYDTQDIAYSRAPGTREYYRFNRWTERPQRSIHAQLAARLGGGPAKGGLRLDTNLDEIYHDAAEQPGTARIAVTAELVDPASRAVLARRSFSRSAPAASYDAPGAVRGFDQALAGLIGDIEAWVAAQAPSKPR
jgi:ABC-type uncharacterized transport system auxiliary subunit